MKEIPLFSVPQLNSFEEYVRFQHSAAYIRAKSAWIPDRFKEDEQRLLPLVRAVGYKKLDRFRMHRRQWDRLERDGIRPDRHPRHHPVSPGAGVRLERIYL